MQTSGAEKSSTALPSCELWHERHLLSDWIWGQLPSSRRISGSANLTKNLWLGSSLAPGVNLLLLFCKLSSKFLSLYPWSSKNLQTSSEKVSLYSGQLTQRLGTGEITEQCVGSLKPWMGLQCHIVPTPTTKTQGTSRKKRQEDHKWQRSWGEQCVFRAWWDCCTHEFSAAMILCSRPVQHQGGQHSSVEEDHQGGGNHKLPPLTKELLTENRCWRRDNQFTHRLWPPVGQLGSGGWPHTHG